MGYPKAEMNEQEIEEFARNQVAIARKIPQVMKMYSFLAKKLKESPETFATMFKTVKRANNPRFSRTIAEGQRR